MRYLIPYPHTHPHVEACRHALNRVDIDMDDVIRLIVERISNPTLEPSPYLSVVTNLQEYIGETVKDPILRDVYAQSVEFEHDIVRGFYAIECYIQPYLMLIPEIQLGQNLCYGFNEVDTLVVSF
jgi:hypothetical protein